eukprot:Skav221942  [mRNA]  locus=scaffold195:430409:436055:+ [translate_table: standard]
MAQCSPMNLRWHTLLKAGISTGAGVPDAMELPGQIAMEGTSDASGESNNAEQETVPEVPTIHEPSSPAASPDRLKRDGSKSSSSRHINDIEPVTSKTSGASLDDLQRTLESLHSFRIALETNQLQCLRLFDHEMDKLKRNLPAASWMQIDVVRSEASHPSHRKESERKMSQMKSGDLKAGGMFFTLLLLLLITYVFAVAFVQFSRDTALERGVFGSMGTLARCRCMLTGWDTGTLRGSQGEAVATLILKCILTDQEDLIRAVTED